MTGLSWPSESEINGIKKIVAQMSGKSVEEVKVVISPYRICPLGAHIDHQGGIVSAMTINRGILLGFVPSNDGQVILRSRQFKGEVSFRVDEIQHPRDSVKENNKVYRNDTSKLQEECEWGNYARGALYALQKRGEKIMQGMIGHISGSEGLDSSGLSSSAAVGVAYLLAFESANNLAVSPTENIELDRLIENEYLGLRNGILDQSAILLSHSGCLTCMNCKTKEHKLICPLKPQKSPDTEVPKAYKLLLAFSGLKHALTNNPGYNQRVAECQKAARILLHSVNKCDVEPLLSNVEPEVYKAHKDQLELHIARRAEHYFSENMRVMKGLEAWASGSLEEFGKLISASGLSSIENYECGSEPLIQLYNILLRAPGVYGGRFSGAGFRGCCFAFVSAEHAAEAASYVKEEYRKAQPKLASQINRDAAVLICEAGDCAQVLST